MNYGCHYQERRGLAFQKFDYTKRTSDNYPEFECSLARGGCHSDNDCHYRPVWCACRGETCVRYVKEKQDTGVSKVKATPNIGSWGDMGWHGCDWRVWASYCACYNYDRHVRRVVWSLPTWSDMGFKNKGLFEIARVGFGTACRFRVNKQTVRSRSHYFSRKFIYNVDGF